MKFLILVIIAIICLSTISAIPWGNKKRGDVLREVSFLVKEKGTLDFSSMKTMFTKYVKEKYPDMEKRKQSRIVKILAHRMKKKIDIEIKKKNLKEEDMFARLLK